MLSCAHRGLEGDGAIDPPRRHLLTHAPHDEIDYRSLREGKVIAYTAIVYTVFWVLGVSVMVASRLGERSGRKSPPRSAPEAGQ